MLGEHYSVAGAIVYGSRARSPHRPDSDADVAVLLTGEHQRFLTTKLAMADVAVDVLLETGVNISPLPVWLDEWEHLENHSNPDLLRSIAPSKCRRHGVVPNRAPMVHYRITELRDDVLSRSEPHRGEPLCRM